MPFIADFHLLESAAFLCETEFHIKMNGPQIAKRMDGLRNKNALLQV